MEVSLTSDAEEWVRAEVSSGRFPTPEAAVRHAIDAEKLRRIRGELEASEAEGGCYSADEVRRFAQEHLNRSAAAGLPGAR